MILYLDLLVIRVRYHSFDLPVVGICWQFENSSWNSAQGFLSWNSVRGIWPWSRTESTKYPSLIRLKTAMFTWRCFSVENCVDQSFETGSCQHKSWSALGSLKCRPLCVAQRKCRTVVELVQQRARAESDLPLHDQQQICNIAFTPRY